MTRHHTRRACAALAAALATVVTSTGDASATAPPTPTAATVPATVPAAMPAVTVPAADREVRFTVDGTLTYATLHIPAHRTGTRLPAALLLPGSGPTDRNGDEPPAVTPGTLRLVAGVLDTDGVASLRFDKYFTGRTGPGAYTGHPERLDLAAFVRQADAAYRVLTVRTDVDPRRLMIVGHSEGGFTGMLVAESVTPRPAALALLEPQDLRLLDLVRLQLDEQLRAARVAGQLDPATAEANERGVAAAIAAFRANKPFDTNGLLRSVATALHQILGPVNARYVHSDDAVYPPAVAARLPGRPRVLVTCGTADTQVPCATTPPLLLGLALSDTSGLDLRVLPGLDHFLHPRGAPVSTPILAPAAVAALHTIDRQLTAGPCTACARGHAGPGISRGVRGSRGFR